MKQFPLDGHETNIAPSNRIEVIGENLPSVHEMYDGLSTRPDIRVLTEAKPHGLSGERRNVSEKELIDNLMDFCATVKQLPIDDMDLSEQKIAGNIDEFVESLYFLSHEAYAEAINGIADRHTQWLQADDLRRVRFAVSRNTLQSSQNKVASDICKAIADADPELAGRTEVILMEELADGLSPDTKIVLTDDWSVSGNHISKDIASTYQVFERFDIFADLEVNLLIARRDQIETGIRAIDQLADDNPNFKTPEIVCYFETPKVRSIYGTEAVPTGSHSSTDYGFSETLGSMYRIIERHGGGGVVHMPYAAKIVPEYAYNYDEQ